MKYLDRNNNSQKHLRQPKKRTLGAHGFLSSRFALEIVKERRFYRKKVNVIPCILRTPSGKQDSMGGQNPSAGCFRIELQMKTPRTVTSSAYGVKHRLTDLQASIMIQGDQDLLYD